MNKHTVMTIDSNERFRMELSGNLQNEGFDVTQSGNAAEALQAIKIKKPDLILLDAVLPDMNGFALCSALKSDPHTSGIPIVFVSSKTSMADKLNGFVCGGYRYLNKPPNLDELIACIQLILQYNPKSIKASRTAS